MQEFDCLPWYHGLKICGAHLWSWSTRQRKAEINGAEKYLMIEIYNQRDRGTCPDRPASTLHDINIPTVVTSWFELVFVPTTKHSSSVTVNVPKFNRFHHLSHRDYKFNPLPCRFENVFFHLHLPRGFHQYAMWWGVYRWGRFHWWTERRKYNFIHCRTPIFTVTLFVDPTYVWIIKCYLLLYSRFTYSRFLAATDQLYNSLCLSVGRSVGLSVCLSVCRSVSQTFSHDDVNRIEAKPLKIESSNLECSLIWY